MDAVTLAAANAVAAKRYASAVRWAILPKDWDLTWRTAWAQAKAGTGVAQMVFEGDSVTAGQAGSTQTDALRFGWVGRLEALMAAKANIQAVGYTMAGLNPPTGLTTTTGPYSGPATTSPTKFDGGVGEVWSPPFAGTSAGDVVISLPAHRISGAFPTSVDVFTIDYTPSTTWAWNLDGGSSTTVTVTGGANTSSAAQLRRTTIPLNGTAAHTLNLGVQSASNALIFMGHQVRYGTAGASLFYNAIQGWKAIDFAVGAGSTAGFGGRNSLATDHIAPWTGQNNTNNAAGSAAPFSADLTVIAAGLNDATYGSRRDAFERYLTRRVHAARRGKTAASVLLVDMAYPSIYSDNNDGTGRPYDYEAYKEIKRRVANTYGCAYLDIDSALGQTPVANGYMVFGDIHPTSNGAGAGGGDGHLLIAQTAATVLGI